MVLTNGGEQLFTISGQNQSRDVFMIFLKMVFLKKNAMNSNKKVGAGIVFKPTGLFHYSIKSYFIFHLRLP